MNILEIVRAISNIVSELGYDGARTKDGSPVEIGLKREEGCPIVDSRVMDGFKVRFSAGDLILTYHAEIRLADIYKGDLEAEVDQTIQDIVNFIKKEFRAATGKALTLTPVGEVQVLAQNTSKVRYFVTANKTFSIGGVEGDPVRGPSKDSVEASFKAYLELPAE